MADINKDERSFAALAARYCNFLYCKCERV